ncbi:Methyltransferase-like protein 6 [Harpegnathos saltator]|uniref:Methyltransferase-like protein 6 n=2 Tax=Harpegnathos saltator TaxID=610380 RepID=E2C2Z9_HARSA|nr:Methyltransferase-like protein 6 [Harpegnathos saltator]
MREAMENGILNVGHVAKRLTAEEIDKMEAQNSRLVSAFRANQLEKDAKKHWDLFYKRNDTRFFKDRHWTMREFEELLGGLGSMESQNVLLEVGCGVGNLVYPLIEDGAKYSKIFACDISSKAIELLKSHTLFDAETIEAFQTDVTSETCFSKIDCSINIATLIFVLSAIHPNKFCKVAENIHSVLGSGGILLFRDYGLYDMAQLRFKPGHKISENFYMRQDGTR